MARSGRPATAQPGAGRASGHERSRLGACVTSGSTNVVCTGTSGPLNLTSPPTISPVTVEVSGSFSGGMSFTDITDVIVTIDGSMNDPITATGGTNFSFVQNGTFGSASIVANSSGTNTLIVNPGRSVGVVNLTGQENVIGNYGTFNNALTLSATQQNLVLNRAGGTMNAISISGLSNTIDNSGTLNAGLQFNQNGQVNDVQNRDGGVINGISSTADAADHVNNFAGRSSASLGADAHTGTRSHRNEAPCGPPSVISATRGNSP